MTSLAGGEDAIEEQCLRAEPASADGGSERLPGGTGDLARGSVWALCAVGTTAASGFVFWVAAAGTSERSADVGRAAAWFTVLQLVVAATALGAPLLLNRTGAAADASRIAGSTIRIVVVGALLLGVFSPLVSGDEWAVLSGASGLPIGLAISGLAAGSALNLVVDARLISLRRWKLLFIRSAAPASLRIPMLFVSPLDDRGTWILIAAAVPLACSGAVATALMIRSGAVAWPTKPLQREHRAFLISQHLSALATHLPYHAVPLIVARHVSSSLNGAFYLVWGIGVMATLVPQTLTQVLLSEASLFSGDRSLRFRVTLFANLVIGLAGWAASEAFGSIALRQLGPSYESLAAVLPWLFVAALCWGVTSVALTETRMADDHKLTVAVTSLIAALALAVTLAQSRTTPVWGATRGWVFAQVAGALLALLFVDRRRGSGRAGYGRV